ncbi:MAG: hypothetical protein ABW063_16425 [Caulobacter sp.]
MTDTNPTSFVPSQDGAGAASEPFGEATQGLADVQAKVVEETRAFAQSAKEKAARAAQSGQAEVATAMEDFAAAMRKAGDELDHRDQTLAARMLGQAVEGLEQFARTLTDKQPEEMVHAVREFGRANPTAFIASSVLAGFALGRFAKSSATHQSNQASQQADSDVADLSAPADQSFQDATHLAAGDLDGAQRQADGGSELGYGSGDVEDESRSSGEEAADDIDGAGQGEEDVDERGASDPMRGL